MKNTGVGWWFLLHGIILTQGSNLGLPHCRQILYYLSHPGSPRISLLFRNFEGNTRGGKELKVFFVIFFWSVGLVCGLGTRDSYMDSYILLQILNIVYIFGIITELKGLPRWCSGKESSCNSGDTRNAGSVPESGRSLE